MASTWAPTRPNAPPLRLPLSARHSVRACNTSKWAMRSISLARHLRDPKTWNAKTYLEEWLTLARAITCSRSRSQVRHARHGGQRRMAHARSPSMWATIRIRPHVTTLTHHYYFGGPATNPANIPNLIPRPPWPGSEDCRHRHRRRRQNARPRPHDRGQHLLSRRQARRLRRLASAMVR